MKHQFCRGCGSVIQTTRPEEAGFVPPEVLERKEENGGNGKIICRRCYRISHYGEIGNMTPGTAQIRQSILKAVEEADLLLIVADFSDLVGSVPVWKEMAGVIGTKPYVLLLNKIDLLPARAKENEVVAYLRDYLRRQQFPEPKAVLPVSGLMGFGIKSLSSRLMGVIREGARVAMLGTTNAGKSSLIKRLLDEDRKSGGVAPTVSKFPGTTVGTSHWKVFGERNLIIDTPGLAPGDRLGDGFCSQCMKETAAGEKLEQKLWGVKPEQGLVIGGLIGILPESEEETIWIAFTQPKFASHRTNRDKVAALLSDPEELSRLGKVCQTCRENLKWREETFQLESHHDLAFAGAGWVSFRSQAITVKLILPEGIRWEVRPALIGKRG